MSSKKLKVGYCSTLKPARKKDKDLFYLSVYRFRRIGKKKLSTRLVDLSYNQPQQLMEVIHEQIKGDIRRRTAKVKLNNSFWSTCGKLIDKYGWPQE